MVLSDHKHFSVCEFAFLPSNVIADRYDDALCSFLASHCVDVRVFLWGYKALCWLSPPYEALCWLRVFFFFYREEALCHLLPVTQQALRCLRVVFSSTLHFHRQATAYCSREMVALRIELIAGSVVLDDCDLIAALDRFLWIG